MEKFKQLCSMCKCSVQITVNDHRDVHETVISYLKGRNQLEGIDPEVLLLMIANDTLVEVQFYPETGIGFHYVCHYDIDIAMEMALKLME